MRTSSAAALAAVFAVAGSLAGAGTAQAATAGVNARTICYRSHVAGIGWEGNMVCNGATSGLPGEGRAVEALNFVTMGMSGLCARAHVATVGWQPWVCVKDNRTLSIGTTGQSLAIEAVEIQTQSGGVTADAYLTGIGWQGPRFGARVTVGTTGESRPVEAVTFVP